jgi:hypothetical protein
VGYTDINSLTASIFTKLKSLKELLRKPPVKNCCHRVKKNQLDAQLIQYISSTSTCFGRTKAHHQEVQPYVYNNWYFLFFLDDLSVVLVGLEQSNQDNRQSS